MYETVYSNSLILNYHNVCQVSMHKHGTKQCLSLVSLLFCDNTMAEVKIMALGHGRI